MVSLTVNGNEYSLDVSGDTPLLWVLRDNLGLTGTKFGCGIGACGACTVHVNDRATYSCLTPVSTISGKTVTTIEGLSLDGQHPLQLAWIAEQVPQCGYCQSGQIMRAAALLTRNTSPTRAEILNEMQANICRCGTYLRIVRAIERAAAGAMGPNGSGERHLLKPKHWQTAVYGSHREFSRPRRGLCTIHSSFVGKTPVWIEHLEIRSAWVGGCLSAP